MSDWTPDAGASHTGLREESCGVLIVEDDADTRENLADILEIDGYRAIMAATAEEALGPRDWSTISIVILDRRLPDGDASELLPRLIRLAPHVAVVIVTGFGDLEGAVLALRHGAADYVLKPVNAGALRATLARLAEKQRLERALLHSQIEVREERDFVENLLETVPSSVLLLDMKGNLIRGNSQWQELTGYALSELKGRNAFDLLLNEADQIAANAKLQRIVTDDRVSGVVTRITTRDGRQVEIRWAGKLLRDDNHQGVAIIVSGQDITELNEAQRRVLQSERLAAIGHAMAGLVHESRNAIQRLSACSEILSLEISDRPEALKWLERIQLAQNDLHQLFEEVREYAAPIHLNRQLTNVGEIWRAAWLELDHLNNGKRVTLREDCGETDLKCSADPFRLRQVFRNLLENAIHAAPANSEVTVRCREVQYEGHAEVRISVCDQGGGIPTAEHAKVLEPFYTTKAKGTGLGLAISQRIIHAHGGRLSIGEASSDGAEFIVEFPRDYS